MRVACIIPTGNQRPEMIAEAIASVKAQTVLVDEIIIMPGESKHTAWIRVNEGVQKSTADAFFVLCDDDMIRPTFVQETVKLMEETNADLVSVALETFGSETGVHQCGKTPFVTALIKKSIWEKTGGYDQGAGPATDYDFYLMCLEKNAKWVKISEPLFLYRKHDVKWSNEEPWDEYMRYIKKKHQL